jgi:hypothetical protein
MNNAKQDCAAERWVDAADKVRSAYRLLSSASRFTRIDPDWLDAHQIYYLEYGGITAKLKDHGFDLWNEGIEGFLRQIRN